jgi:hypothetical protein
LRRNVIDFAVSAAVSPPKSKTGLARFLEGFANGSIELCKLAASASFFQCLFWLPF